MLADVDSLRLPEVVRRYTNWPTASGFGSVVQHEHIEEHPEFIMFETIITTIENTSLALGLVGKMRRSTQGLFPSITRY